MCNWMAARLVKFGKKHVTAGNEFYKLKRTVLSLLTKYQMWSDFNKLVWHFIGTINNFEGCVNQAAHPHDCQHV